MVKERDPNTRGLQLPHPISDTSALLNIARRSVFGTMRHQRSYLCCLCRVFPLKVVKKCFKITDSGAAYLELSAAPELCESHSTADKLTYKLTRCQALFSAK